ncbi:MAG TPA: glycosyltransferase [Acidimicrobiia bacterium]|nr:glycosyltransferase [Acidimicrobiia bacterium]
MTPFWSVMIPTYRTEPRLLHACVTSVLANGVDDKEVVIVNDGPPLGFDPGVRVVDNAHNLGAPGNFDECVRLAQGEWVHILHADDAVMPGFYDAYRAVIERDDVVMVGGQAVVIDGAYHWTGLSPAVGPVDAAVIASRHPCNFASTVVRRAAYEKAGPFDASLVHANDWEMWVRIACQGAVGWVDRPWAYYRRHGASSSDTLYASAGYIHDCLRAIDTFVPYFESTREQQRVRAGARMVVSDYALAVAADHARAGRRRAAVRDALWGVRVRPNLSSMGRAADTIARALF